MCKTHYAPIKKLNVFVGNKNENLICKKCLNSYKSENMLVIHEPKCENYDITTIRTSRGSHLRWKNHFLKNKCYFRIIAEFQADNENDSSGIGIKTTIIYKQNPVLNGYHIESELNDVPKSGYFESPLDFNNVDWFVD